MQRTKRGISWFVDRGNWRSVSSACARISLLGNRAWSAFFCVDFDLSEFVNWKKKTRKWLFVPGDLMGKIRCAGKQQPECLEGGKIGGYFHRRPTTPPPSLSLFISSPQASPPPHCSFWNTRDQVVCVLQSVVVCARTLSVLMKWSVLA